MPKLGFVRLRPNDLFTIEVQESQRVQLGMAAGGMSDELAALIAAQPIAWTACAGRRIIACFGIAEQFEGRQGLAWSLLAPGLGPHLLPLTRFMATILATCGLNRIELIAKCADLEPAIQWAGHSLDPAELVALALRFPTVQMRWASLLGMAPAHVLRCYGQASESYLLYELIRPPVAVPQERAA